MAGAHTIRVVSPGAVPFVRQVELRAGDSAQVRAILEGDGRMEGLADHVQALATPDAERMESGAPIADVARALELDKLAIVRVAPGRAAGQVELASFRNPQGLQTMGGNVWIRTVASGDAVVGVPGDGNMGALQSGALEESNVDLTAELVNMVTAQRAYQANAQTIKTQDQVLQTIVNLR